MDQNKYRTNHKERPALYVYIDNKTKRVLKQEAKLREMSLSKLVREVLDTAATQLNPKTMRRKE